MWLKLLLFHYYNSSYFYLYRMKSLKKWTCPHCKKTINSRGSHGHLRIAHPHLELPLETEAPTREEEKITRDVSSSPLEKITTTITPLEKSTTPLEKIDTTTTPLEKITTTTPLEMIIPKHRHRCEACYKDYRKEEKFFKFVFIRGKHRWSCPDCQAYHSRGQNHAQKNNLEGIK